MPAVAVPSLVAKATVAVAVVLPVRVAVIVATAVAAAGSFTLNVAALNWMQGRVSTIVSVACWRTPSTEPPVGSVRLRLTVWLPSQRPSSVIDTVKVATICRGAKVRIPDVAV